MKTLSALLFPATGILFFPGCKEDSPCGAKWEWTSDVQDLLTYNSYESFSNTRYLIYEDLTSPEDICPDEHVRATFSVYLEPFAYFPPNTSIKGKAYWGLYADEVNLEFDTTQGRYFGEIDDIGLKQAFGEDPGWIGLQILINMESFGSLDQDTAFVKAATDQMYIDFDYYKFAL